MNRGADTELRSKGAGTAALLPLCLLVEYCEHEDPRPHLSCCRLPLLQNAAETQVSGYKPAAATPEVGVKAPFWESARQLAPEA